MEAFLSDSATWVLVAFLIFAAFAIWKGWAPLMAALDKRSDAIKAELEEARTLREEAQALLAEYQRKQRDASDEADKIIQHANEEAARVRAKSEEDLKDSLARREQQARDRIAQAEAQAIADVRNTAADVALKATAEIIRSKLGSDAADKLVNETIEKLPGHLN